MSTFSTGELAKAAEVSVRTVQYYDQRGILTPSKVTEGGRRIYHESDLERLKVICFLRDLDFSINQKITAKRNQLSLDDLSDISRLMENQKSWHHLQWRIYGSIVLISLLYLVSLLIVSYYFKDPRGLFIVCPAFVILVNLLVLHYRKQFEYLCPNCHKIFDPSFKEFALASHTPRTRKLTCPHCHMKAYCLELAKSQTKWVFEHKNAWTGTAPIKWDTRKHSCWILIN